MKLIHVSIVVVYRPSESGRQFLVALRAPERGRYWHLIGGAVEEAESTGEAARRELEEETGLALRRVEEIPMSLGYEDGGDLVALHVFAAEAAAGWEPRLDDEHVDYRWCSAGSAIDLLEYEEPREAVREVARRLGEVFA